MQLLHLCLAATALVPSVAFAETLTFSSVPTGTFTSIDLGDYVLNYAYGDKGTIVDVKGTNVLEDSNQQNLYGANVLLSRLDGGVFSLNSVEAAMNPGGLGAYGLQIAGSTFYTLPTTLTTENISGAQDVTSALFNIGDFDTGYQVTDLNVTTPTPEPSSLALLGTGILGTVGVLRRKLSR